MSDEPHAVVGFGWLWNKDPCPKALFNDPVFERTARDIGVRAGTYGHDNADKVWLAIMESVTEVGLYVKSNEAFFVVPPDHMDPDWWKVTLEAAREVLRFTGAKPTQEHPSWFVTLCWR